MSKAKAEPLIEEQPGDELAIVKLTIQDVMCIQHVELNLGRLPAGKGRLYEFFAGNEQGKSSLHDACASIFEPGKHPELIRDGASKAIVIADLSDGHQIIRTHEPTESSFDIIGPSGVAVSAPATFIKKLARGFAFDPLKFDKAEPKKQLEYLLSISSIEFTPAELAQAAGDAARMLEFPDRPIPLSSPDSRDPHFGKFHKQVTDLRAATGRRRDERTSTIESLRKTIAVQVGDGQIDESKDLSQELAALQTERDTLAAHLQHDVEDITEQARERRENPDETALLAGVEATNNELVSVVAKMRSLLGKLPIAWRKTALRDIYQNVGGELDEAEQRRIADIDAAEQRSIASIKASGAEARQQNAVRLAETTAAINAQAGIKANRDLKAQMERDVAVIVADYDALALAAQELDALRKSKLETSFVRGLEVRDDLIYIDGVVWTKVNSAKRYEKSLEICAQGVGDLGFVVADDGEKLDADSRNRFRKGVEKSGLAVILFSVSTPEQLKQYGPAIHTIPPGLISNMQIARKRV